ncbi:oligosaccharide repeat unit polymerase [Lacrimispora xylanisolvens]|uniref:Oligosaccharide repeat unit polymerase n=1 Tax=Lacrimispora xylanisolvens TaxID=384636 RepID=A0A2S6HT73_9FIRM|nr:O-antigen polymerase [Hungatella xylanolytica]PPK80943.1 oligosaccharide repeat unit polymerase [Hungatella xylanolytica]
MSVYLISYAASYLFARAGYYWLSGLILMLAALFLYWYDYRRTENIIHLRGLFSLFWVGGEGVACLKLSELSSDWSIITWLCFLVAYLGFYMTFEFMIRTQGSAGGQRSSWFSFKGYEKPLFLAMLLTTVLSLGAFLIEAAVLGFIPFFIKGMPHAYSTFHITGIHYFTVSCVLVPALSVLYFSIEQGRNGFRLVITVLMDLIACAIPVLCVSRFQLILAVGLAILTYIAMEHRLKIIYGVGLLLGMIPIYVILTIARGHDVTYLNGIFQMKYSQMPIFITQPYMYIANNYENFNCLVEWLPSHTFGLRMLFPLWALSGLKFLVPALVDFPIYVTKEELTTVTLFYDSFYDFGIVGVILFSCILGAVAFFLMRLVKRVRNPIGYLFYAQFAMYLILSFFTTWYSNPATWFYFALTGALYVFCSWKNNGRHE